MYSTALNIFFFKFYYHKMYHKFVISIQKNNYKHPELCLHIKILTLKCRRGETKIVVSAIFFLDRQKMLLR